MNDIVSMNRKGSPLSADQCRRKAQRCLKKGGFRFGKAPDTVRALMEERDLTINDLLNVLRAERATVTASWDSDFEEWRYSMETQRIKVLIAFETPERVVLVTFWRIKRR